MAEQRRIVRVYPEFGKMRVIRTAIQGPRGNPGPPGPPGEPGELTTIPVPGPDGKSAYEIWLEDGNVGTETDFIESLRGDPGSPGEQGGQGPPGSPGSQGGPGQSAYEVWLDAGNTGTVEEYLESLIGPAGPPGEAGTGGGGISIPSGTTAPENPESGDLWNDTTLAGTSVMKYYDGDEWIRMDGGGGLPNGIVSDEHIAADAGIAWSKIDVPPGLGDLSEIEAAITSLETADAGFSTALSSVESDLAAEHDHHEADRTALEAMITDIELTPGPAGPAGPPYIDRGSYNSGTTYAKNDIVLLDGSSYLNVNNNGSTGVSPLVNNSTSTWQLFARGFPGVVSWSSGSTYQIGHVTTYQGSSYVSTMNNNVGNNPAGAPTSQWRVLASKGDTGSQGIQGIQGIPGADSTVPGPPGEDGVGVPAGGGTGQLLAKNSATDYDTEWVDAPTGGGGGSGSSLVLRRKANMTPKFVVGRYYDGIIQPTAGTHGTRTATTATTLYVMPFYVPEAITIDRIGVVVTTGAAGGAVRAGLYNTGSDGMPSTLLLDSGSFDATTTGGKEAIVSQALEADTLYWTALMPNGVSVVLRGSVTSIESFGYAAIADTGAGVPQFYYAGQTAFTLTSDLSGATPTFIAAGSSSVFSVRLRVASVG